MSAKYNLVCDQATTFNFQFVIQDDQNGVTTPWNLTNYSATMTVRPFVGSTETTVVASTTNGRITLGGVQGRITVTIDAATTGAITPARYAYDLILDSGSVITRILEGKFVVTGAVTNP
jgi:hypothetical protein